MSDRRAQYIMLMAQLLTLGWRLVILALAIGGLLLLLN